MGKRTIRWVMMMGVLCAGAPGLLRAQQCDDGLACTTNDVCSDGTCSGTFQPGGSCDDGDECTVNDRCQNDPDLGSICRGDPGEPDTPCQGGCGTCQQLAPIPDLPLTCAGDPADDGKECDFGTPCLSGACRIIDVGVPGVPNPALCIPQQKVCPDTDGNLCTDNCNFETGQCEKNAPKCFPGCETCNPNSGACEPTNIGGPCDDFNVCSAQSHCEIISGHGLCLVGEPTVTGDTPTPTATPRDETPTPTVPATAPASPPATATITATQPPMTPPTPGACVGDCNGNNVVAVNELIIGVNIVLGSAQLSQCAEFDTNGNGAVAINELIGGVNSLLNGCV